MGNMDFKKSIISDFSGYIPYLNNFRKINKFSIRDLCSLFGYKSPGSLHRVLSGKQQISQKGASRICISLKLSGDDSFYFRFLTIVQSCSLLTNIEKFNLIQDRKEKIWEKQEKV